MKYRVNEHPADWLRKRRRVASALVAVGRCRPEAGRPARVGGGQSLKAGPAGSLAGHGQEETAAFSGGRRRCVPEPRMWFSVVGRAEAGVSLFRLGWPGWPGWPGGLSRPSRKPAASSTFVLKPVGHWLAHQAAGEWRLDVHSQAVIARVSGLQTCGS